MCRNQTAGLACWVLADGRILAPRSDGKGRVRMSASYKKAIKKLRKMAEEQHWREQEKKGGWMLYSPDGVTKVMVHKTASDPHAFGNLLSEMRSGGFEWSGGA